MINNMASRCIASAITEPLLAEVAHDHTVRLVNPTILASIFREFLAEKFLIFFFEL